MGRLKYNAENVYSSNYIITYLHVTSKILGKLSQEPSRKDDFFTNIISSNHLKPWFECIELRWSYDRLSFTVGMSIPSNTKVFALWLRVLYLCRSHCEWRGSQDCVCVVNEGPAVCVSHNSYNRDVSIGHRSWNRHLDWVSADMLPDL